MTRRVLVLMRHGKSGYPEGVADYDRPLAERGRREAGLAGDWVRANQPPVDAVLCSAALRTRQTLDATAVTAQVSYEPGIYEGTPERLIELIRATDDAVRTLLLIGHAPGVPRTAWDLAADHESEAAMQLGDSFPTSALAVVEFDASWVDIGIGSADLTAFHVAR